MFNFFKKKNQGSGALGDKKAQADSGNLTTLELKVDGMHCASCSMNIDGELEDIDGVVEASTSYAGQKTKVTYDESKTGKEELVATIEELGYKVEG
jgi:copper chaperone CopZ